jgi:hypothetical protein
MELKFQTLACVGVGEASEIALAFQITKIYINFTTSIAGLPPLKMASVSFSYFG